MLRFVADMKYGLNGSSVTDIPRSEPGIHIGNTPTLQYNYSAHYATIYPWS